MQPDRHDGWPDPDNAATPAEAQVGLLLHEYGNVAEPGPENWRETGIQFFVRRHFVLVRDAYAQKARLILADARLRPAADRPAEEAAQGPGNEPGNEPFEEPVEESVERPQDGDRAYGVQWVRLADDVSVFTALRALREGFRTGQSSRTDLLGGAVGPELLVHAAHDHGTVCPADEPQPVRRRDRPEPPVSHDHEAGRGVRVLVVDTGLDPAATGLSWMGGVTGDPDPGVVPSGPGHRTINRYAGHGTFIAGVIRAVAPAAEVIVRAGFPAPVPSHQHPPGTTWEGELVKSLERFLVQDSPDIINLSAGTLAERPEGPMLLNAFHDDVLRRYKGVVLVAAAGNDGARRPFWPAAAPWAVGVGALSADHRHRARFSNFGGWVDGYAPGERLVNAFPSGDYRYDEPPYAGSVCVFHGMARWSGTSFAAPVVAGMIAARMSRTGENGWDAAHALLVRARRRALPGVGAVLRPRRKRPRHGHGR